MIHGFTYTTITHTHAEQKLSMDTLPMGKISMNNYWDVQNK